MPLDAPLRCKRTPNNSDNSESILLHSPISGEDLPKHTCRVLAEDGSYVGKSDMPCFACMDHINENTSIPIHNRIRSITLTTPVKRPRQRTESNDRARNLQHLSGVFNNLNGRTPPSSSLPHRHSYSYLESSTLHPVDGRNDGQIDNIENSLSTPRNKRHGLRVGFSPPRRGQRELREIQNIPSRDRNYPETPPIPLEKRKRPIKASWNNQGESLTCDGLSYEMNNMTDLLVPKTMNKSRSRFKWLQITLVVLLLFVFFSCILGNSARMITFHSLKSNHDMLKSFGANNVYITSIIFFIVFSATIAFIIPGATVLALAAGILFPQPFAATIASAGAIFGSCCAFWVAQTAGGDSIKESVEKYWVTKRLKTHVNNETPCVLVMTLTLIRLPPFIPKWLVNATCAFLGVDFKYFLISTVLGVFPDCYLLTQSGEMFTEIVGATLHKIDTVPRFLFAALTSKAMLAPVMLLVVWGILIFVIRQYLAPRIDYILFNRQVLPTCSVSRRRIKSM